MQTWLMDKMDMEVQRKNIHSENTPLHQAIYAGEVEKALALIPETADLNLPEPTFLLTPIHLAARSGHLHVVEALLEAGANPDSRDDGGMSPLHKAAENGFLEIVQLLISKKVSIDPGAFGRGMYTPMMMAVMKDHLEIVETLLLAGADPCKKDKRGRTCYTHAEEKPLIKDLLRRSEPGYYPGVLDEKKAPLSHWLNGAKNA